MHALIKHQLLRLTFIASRLILFPSPPLPSIQLPSELYLSLQTKLSLDDRYWTLAGSKLDLLSVEVIEFRRRHPLEGGNGGVVLKAWQQSTTKTHKDLIEALTEVGLESAAKEVEKYFLGH